MLDIGWSELLVVGVLALLVVGPKELPRLMRTVGQWAGRARGLAREFQRSMDDVAREADIAELAEARKMLEDVRSVQSEATKGLGNPGQWMRDAAQETITGDEPAPAEPSAAEAVPPGPPEPEVKAAAAPAGPPAGKAADGTA